MNGLGPFILIIVVAVLLALLGLVLVRRTVPYDRLARHTDVVRYVSACIEVIYAVILAQVVIAAWQEYQDARAMADDEANAVLNLARLAQVWPDEDRERLITLLLLLEHQFDTPYEGVSAIEPTAMGLVRTEIDAGLGTIGGQS